MKSLPVWLAVTILCALALFFWGYMSASSSCQQQHMSDVADAFALQQDIDSRNAEITAGLITAAEHRAAVQAAINEERRNHVQKPGCYIDIGTVSLLNAARRNTMPATEYPRGGVVANTAASDVSDQTLINADIATAAQYNAMRERCNAVFEKIKNYQAIMHE